MTLKFNSPSFFQHLIWLPVRLFMVIFCSVKIKGIENIKNTSGTVLFASNHVTEIDPLLIVASLPFFSNKLPIIYVVLEKKSYGQIWGGWRKKIYGGNFFKLIGGYEAYRGTGDYEVALRNHVQAIQKEQSVCIFPVGKRHTKEDIHQARGGVAYLTKEMAIPIIPIHIQGIHRNIPIKSYLQRKQKLTITFGSPLHASDLFRKPHHKITKHERDEFEYAAIELMKKITQLQ